MRLASRMERLGTETAFEILAKAKALEAKGKDIIHLEIGEPDFDTPEHIRVAGAEALENGFTHYTPSPGIAEVRASIANHQTERQGYDVSPGNIVITPGAKPIMFFTIMALVEEGDEVIYPDPGFPIYKSMIDYMGGKAVPMRLHEENGFNADIDALRASVNEKTKLIIVNSPNNPCGSVIPKSDLAEIAEIAKSVDAVVLADEVYKDLYYEGQHESISQFDNMRERTVILDGMSKSYAMTGWRMGYGVFPDALVEPISRLITNSVSCTNAPTQIAAAAAIDGPQDSVKVMLDEFRTRRELIVGGLNNIKGISCIQPKGAFYTFANIKGTGMSSQEFSDRMLAEGGVALLSGTAFGDFGEGYIRLSFANSQENLTSALGRIEAFLKDKV
jgi:aspartate aminotransferase